MNPSLNSLRTYLFVSIVTVTTLFFSSNAHLQNVAINTTGAVGNPSAMLDVNSTNTGLLIPRVALSATNVAAPVAAPATSLLIYNMATAGVVPNNVTPGYYYWDGVKWVRLLSSTTTGVFWSVLGNAGTVNGTHFLGTTDNVPLSFRVNNENAGKIDHINFNAFWGHRAGTSMTSGSYNTAIGEDALFGCTTGTGNTALGEYSLYSLTTGTSNTAVGVDVLSSSTTGNFNTAVGTESMFLTTTGYDNAALGVRTLYSNTTGFGLVAVGSYSMYNNTTGLYNSGLGSGSLYANTTGSYNTGSGNEALHWNTTGNYNTASGTWSLRFNTTGSYNSVLGYDAMASNTIGIENCAIGTYALLNNIDGGYNSAIGSRSMLTNIGGDYNSAVGHEALNYNIQGNQNTAVGKSALYNNTTGNGNTAVGYNAFLNGTIFNNSTALGNQTVITASDQVRIGNGSVTSIGGQVGWTTLSDRRVKVDLKENIPGLAFISRLHPVSYLYDIQKENEILGLNIAQLNDSTSLKTSIRYSGFIAQDVDSIANQLGFDFSAVDKSGDLWGLRYADFVVPLVKAVQELNAIVECQQQTIDKLNQRIESISGKQ